MIEQLIRGRLGFTGVLISDCIYMDALGGTLPERCRAVLASGMDIALSSQGDVEQWQGIAAAARPLTDASLGRLARHAVPAPALPLLDVALAVREIGRLLAA